MVALGLCSTVLLTSRAQVWAQSLFQFEPAGTLASQSAVVAAPPQILNYPQPQIVTPGWLASFSVVAADTRALLYQWRFNGSDLPGSTRDTLLLTNVTAGHVGQYSVVLMNPSGSVTSSPAALLLDTDRDSLPDTWELAQFGNLSETRTGDPDRDGASNVQEYQDGTAPNNKASRLLRLTVFSGGGSVSVSPQKSGYVDGETVTLVAAPHAVEAFRGWGGALAGDNPTQVLTLTNHAVVYAYYGGYELTWTNTAGGNWEARTNWSPNLAPTAADSVSIARAVTVTLNTTAEVASLRLGGSGTAPVLQANGQLTLRGDSAWAGGTIRGSGKTRIVPGATMTLYDDVTLTMSGGHTLENAGRLEWLGPGTLYLSGSVITNLPEGLFEAQGTTTISVPSSGGPSRFDNAGTFVKSGAGIATLRNTISFANSGSVQIQGGNLTLEGPGLNAGEIGVAAGSVLELAGSITATAGSSITGSGDLAVEGTANLAGLVNLAGTHTFRSGTANFTGTLFCTNNVLVVSGGTANFSANGFVSPARLTLSAGTIRGTSSVTPLVSMVWSGGTMSGSGSTFIPPAAELNLNAAFTTTLAGGRILDNAGTFLWTGAGSLSLSDAVITNRPGGLFQADSAAIMTVNTDGSRFDNAGTFRKTSAGNTSFNGLLPFNNYGLVEVQNGSLRLSGGGVNEGTISVAAGATLYFVAGVFTGSGLSEVTGPGNLQVAGTVNLAGLVQLGGSNTFSAGTANFTGAYFCTNNVLTIAGGTANFNGTGLVSPDLLRLSSGTLGGSNTVTPQAAMTWSGGTMTGPGRTFIPAAVLLNINNAQSVTLGNGRRLDIEGTALWTGSGTMLMSGSVITNRPNAVFELRSTAGIQVVTPPVRWDNAGLLRKISAGNMPWIGCALNNYGRLEIENGNLSLSAGGLNEGVAVVGPGATLVLQAGVYSQGASSSLTGAGHLTVAGATANLSGFVNLSGSNTFSGGTAHLTGAYFCTNNALTISGGTANFNGTGHISPATLILTSGTLGGNNLVTPSSAFHWSGGSMNGPGRTVIPANLSVALNNSSSVTFSGGRILDNLGTLIWTGSGNLLFSGATITNRPGALFEVRNAGTFSVIGGINRIDNAGTFRKTSVGTTSIAGSISLNNDGVLDLEKGLLSAFGGYTCTTNAMLRYSLAGTNAGADYGRLQVTGPVALNGALSIQFAGGYLPNLNDSYVLLTATSRTGTFTSFDYPSNQATLVLSNSPNSVVVRVKELAPVNLQPSLKADLAGAELRLSWATVSNSLYSLEYSSTLPSPTWTPSAAPIRASSNSVMVLEPILPTNRFYRVRLIP